MSEFTPITTQEDLDKVIIKRLERERAKFSDYDNLKAKIEDLETEKANLNSTIESYKESDNSKIAKIAELENKISEWELISLKQQVAIKNGLPFELHSRLTGIDEESLTEDAERLASLMNIGKNIPLKDIEPNSIESGSRLTAAFRQAVRDLK